MHRAQGFIDLEEENERIERELARTQEEVTKARVEREERMTRHECIRTPTVTSPVMIVRRSANKSAHYQHSSALSVSAFRAHRSLEEQRLRFLAKETARQSH